MMLRALVLLSTLTAPAEMPPADAPPLPPVTPPAALTVVAPAQPGGLYRVKAPAAAQWSVVSLADGSDVDCEPTGASVAFAPPPAGTRYLVTADVAGKLLHVTVGTAAPLVGRVKHATIITDAAHQSAHAALKSAASGQAQARGVTLHLVAVEALRQAGRGDVGGLIRAYEDAGGPALVLSDAQGVQLGSGPVGDAAGLLGAIDKAQGK